MSDPDTLAWLWATAPGEDVLEAASNRGTVRRATKFVENAAVRLASGDEHTAELDVEHFRVRLYPAGPNAARCDCPVSATCVHVIAAYLWATAHDDGVPRPPVDPVQAVLGWDIATVTHAVGIAAVRVVAAETPDPGASLIVDASSLTVSWPDADAPRVVIAPGSGPAGIVVSGARSVTSAQVWRLRAVVSVFAMHGREWSWPADVASVNHLSDTQRRAARELGRVCESLVAHVLSRLAPGAADELERAAEWAAVHDLRLLARLGRGASATVRALHARDDDARESACLAALAETWALAKALATTDQAVDPALLGGRHRGGESACLGPMIPLAVLWWDGADGSRGITWYGWDTDAREIEQVTSGRAAGVDPGFSRSWSAPLVWNASAETLCSGVLHLDGAERREDATLAATARTTVAVQPFDELDLRQLADQVNRAARGATRAAFGASRERVRLVLPRSRFGLGAIELDEVMQRLIWPVIDVEGRTYRLSLEANEQNARTLSWLVAHTAVRAITVVGDRPEAVFLDDPEGLRLVSVTLTPLPQPSEPPGFLRRLLGRDRERRALAPEARGIERLLIAVEDLLASWATTGGPPSSRLDAALVARTRELDELGLATLADALRQLRADSETAPADLLWAAFLVQRLRTLSA